MFAGLEILEEMKALNERIHKQKDVTLTVTVADNLTATGALVVTDDGGQPPPYTYTADGDYTVTISATDEAGNVGSAQVSFTIDRSPPPAVTDLAAFIVTWQMLLPIAETRCNVFGTNDLASLTGWGGGRVDGAGDYAWNLWRPYKCCRRRGQLFLFDIDWFAYPP